LPYYDGVNAKPRESGTLHGHFCELYSALKSGICLLSVLNKELLCPTFIETANEEEFITYASKLYESLLSKPKTFKPRKWWSLEVVQLLLKLHVQSQYVYGLAKQDAATLAKANRAIKEATKGKKAIDDQNREEAIKKQRKIEEEDRIKNSQQRDKMVESSSKLVDVFQSISSHIINGPAAANNAMNERIGSLESKVDNMLNSLAQLVPLIQQQLNQNKNG
jgi:hypothetical protein